jgi:hypothetical protein
MEACVLFIDQKSGDQLASVRMPQPPAMGTEVELGPVIGEKHRYEVTEVVWQVFSDSRVASSAVVGLRRMA